ncbi:MAG: DUF1295 domain-containing protein [Fuerstiella sp.]
MTTTVLMVTFGAVLLHTTIAWLISVLTKRADVIDPFWGPGFIVVVMAAAWSGQGAPDKARVVLVALVAIWGLRLGLHLLTRWMKEPHEDRRYAAMRQAGTDLWWLRSLITVFWLQAAILWVVATPLIYAVTSTTEVFRIGVACGIFVYCVGLFFETVSDYQLTMFRSRSDSTGQVLSSGLWKYTRHPNYFGDFVVWWSFFSISIFCGAPWWTIISPLIMSVLLMKFSGVGMLEKDIKERRLGYSEYVERTNSFFPWFPKKLSTNDD